jgi:saxitoxin biosynthesis operon SxtJ-like protein
LAQRSPARLTPREGRKFALTLAVAFGVLAGVAWWRESSRATLVFGALAGAFALSGLLVPGKLGPVYRAWMGFAHALSRITTPIFMAVVYFLVITPIAVIRRTLGGNPLRAHRGATGWVDRQQAPRGDLTRQF